MTAVLPSLNCLLSSCLLMPPYVFSPWDLASPDLVASTLSGLASSVEQTEYSDPVTLAARPVLVASERLPQNRFLTALADQSNAGQSAAESIRDATRMHLTSLHDDLPDDVLDLLTEETLLGETWLGIAETGSTDEQGDALWFAVSNGRSVLCDLAEGRVRSFNAPVGCEESRLGRDAFHSDGETIFAGHRFTSSPLRTLAARTEASPCRRTYAAAQDLLDSNPPAAFRILTSLSDYCETGHWRPGDAGVNLAALRVLRAAAAFESDRGPDLAIQTPIPHRYADADQAVERAWLALHLEEDELLLAWLPTTTAPADGAGHPFRLMLTDRRSLLVSVDSKGEAQTHSLDPSPHSGDEFGYVSLGEGERQEVELSGTDALRQDLGAARAVEGTERIREVSRRLWRASVLPQTSLAETTLLSDSVAAVSDLTGFGTSTRDQDREQFLRLARALAERGTEEDRLILHPILHLLAEDDGADVHAPTSPLDDLVAYASRTESARPLTDQVRAWRLPVVVAEAVWPVEEASTRVENWAAWSLPLYRAKRDAEIEDAETIEEKVLVDVPWATRLIEAGQSGEAVSLVEGYLADLPDETHEDLLPAPDEDVSEGQGGQTVHVALLDVLRSAPRETSRLDPLQRLAELQPLVQSRLKDLRPHVHSDRQDHIDEALALLRGDFRPSASVPPVQRGLSPSHRDALRHPATQDGGFMDFMAGFLAETDEPDASELRARCERITEDAHPMLSNALTDATLVLGLSGLRAYVSRGDESIGIRGIDENPPILVIGGHHLDDAHPAFLSEAALRYAVGSEAAHIAFDHTRVTTHDLRRGIWNKTKSATELLISLLPGIAKLPQFQKLSGNSATKRAIKSASQLAKKSDAAAASSAAKLLDDPKTSQVIDALMNSPLPEKAKELATSTSADGSSPSVSADEQAMLAMSRVMQLTADRAGLLLSRSLGDTLRAILLLDPRRHDLLSLVERHGLDAVLSRRDDEGAIVNQNLAIRMAALISFYISDAYDRLCDEVYA
jgi:hypothetical protein